MFIKITKQNYGSFIVEDSNFTSSVIEATGSVAAVIQAYEHQKLPVASNLARYYVSLFVENRYNKTKCIERIEQDDIYFAQWRPNLNYAKYKKCLINQIKKLEYIGK